MIGKSTQETLMANSMHFNVYHVFRSKVRFDIFIKTSLGVLQYDPHVYDWIPTDFKTVDEFKEAYKNYPIYSHGEVVDNLTFWKLDTVKSLTDVSYKDL